LQIVGQEVAQTATLKVLQVTALSALASALSLPSNLMRFTRLIDGAWALCVTRADDAGIQLAKSLLLSTAGHRPVTLIGYGMGARMIYSCLKELALHQERWEDEREKADPSFRKNQKHKSVHPRRKWSLQVRKTKSEGAEDPEMTTPFTSSNLEESSQSSESDGCEEKSVAKQEDKANVDQPNIKHTLNESDNAQKEDKNPKNCGSEVPVTYTREPASIVEDAILMGCPAYIHRPSWEACRRVVGGRLVNCYNPSDLILALMFQYECMSGLFRPTCGTYAINVSGVENYNVSKLITAHSDYSLAVGEILEMIQHGHPVASPIDQSNNVDMEEEPSDSEDDVEDDESCSHEAEGPVQQNSQKRFLNLFELTFSRGFDRARSIESKDSKVAESEEKFIKRTDVDERTTVSNEEGKMDLLD